VEGARSARNFLAEVILHEQASQPGLSHAVGFKFREADDGTGYFVYFTVLEKAGWYLQQTSLENDAPKSSVLLYRPNILFPRKVGNEKVNQIRLLVDGTLGVLMVDGHDVAEMELPDTRDGKISLVAGMLKDDYFWDRREKSGSTRYDGFTVWALQ
jgi:hypothetical protein